MRTSHFITDETTVKSGYQLLSLLFAAYDFDDLYRDSDPDPLDDLLQYQDELISEKLVSLSALARVCDDEMDVLKSIEANFPEGVGTLTPENNETIPLSIREACNKVIHANSIKYDFAWSDENPIWSRWYSDQGIDNKGEYKTPALVAGGERQNGNKWDARIELVPFIYAISLWDLWKWKLA